jgi:hypothetical protein
MRVPPIALPVAGSALLWALIFLSVPPSEQEFPLNDDWAYARGAVLFAEGKGIHYSNWASMPQLGQWIWSLPFLAVLGKSHTALRLSTIVLSWFGLWAYYDLLRQEGVPDWKAALLAATLAFNPLFFLLEGTYMTDVPALSMSLAALAFYGRALAGGGLTLLALGSGIAVLAAVTRQNTIIVPVVAAVLLLRNPGLRTRVMWWAGVILPGIVGIGTHLWLQGRTDTRLIAPELPPADVLLLLPFLLVHTFGLSALPLLLVGDWRRGWAAAGVALAVMLALAIFWNGPGVKYLPYGGLFPYSENMITPWGAFAGSRFTGPLEVGARPLVLGSNMRWALTTAGCVAGAFWIARVLRREILGLLSWPIVLFSLLQLPFLLVAPDLYDRYLLMLLPGALYLAVPARAGFRFQWIPTAGILAAMAAISMALMHDWLAWNSARWVLGGRALAAGVNAWDIEGGFEWDGGFSPERSRSASVGPRRGLTLPFTHRWFPQVSGRFALSFSQPPNTIRRDSQEYRLWLSPGPRQFLLIEAGPVSTAIRPSN